MEPNNLKQAFDFLIKKSKEQGYISLDDVLSCSLDFRLEVDDVDRLSGMLSESGIILESKPAVKETTSVSLNGNDDGILSSGSEDSILQSRAEEIYKAVVELDESLKNFIDIVRAIPPADKKEMVHIQYQVIEGNDYARRRAIEGNLRIAIILAYRESIAFNRDVAECIEDACLALVLACDSYRPDEHQTFAGYISLAIIDALARSSIIPLFSIPANILNVCRRLYKKRVVYSLDRSQAIRFIQDNSNYDENWSVIIYEVLNYSFVDDNFLNDKCEDYYSENSYENFASNLENEFERKNVQILLNKIMKQSLSSKESEIINLRFGLNGNSQNSLLEIAEKNDLSRERIRQLEKRAISKLQNKKNSIKDKFPFEFNEYVQPSSDEDEE